MFLSTLIPALVAFAIGLIIAWLIWGADRSDNA
jgi:uncharacterized membrane protein YciS (DUF1049 family)